MSGLFSIALLAREFNPEGGGKEMPAPFSKESAALYQQSDNNVANPKSDTRRDKY